MTICSGCVFRNAANRSGGHESASEQPAWRSGSRTVLLGLRILAVSAIKWTPANTMMSASVSAASRASPRLSPM